MRGDLVERLLELKTFSRDAVLSPIAHYIAHAVLHSASSRCRCCRDDLCAAHLWSRSSRCYQERFRNAGHMINAAWRPPVLQKSHESMAAWTEIAGAYGAKGRSFLLSPCPFSHPSRATITALEHSFRRRYKLPPSSFTGRLPSRFSPMTRPNSTLVDVNGRYGYIDDIRDADPSLHHPYDILILKYMPGRDLAKKRKWAVHRRTAQHLKDVGAIPERVPWPLPPQDPVRS